MKRFLKLNYFKYYPFFILVLLVVFAADTAVAHRVVIFAWIDGDAVLTQSQFPDGRKIADGQVRVFDENHNLLVNGKTDQHGEFSFKIPKITSLNIVLDAGMGHQGEWKLSEDEIKISMGSSDQEPRSEKNINLPDTNDFTHTHSHASGSQTGANSPQDAGSGIYIDEKQLDQIVEKAIEKVLDKKLQPINRMLAQMHNKGPSVNDIFGGIGYILGLMGIAAYFLSRKKL